VLQYSLIAYVISPAIPLHVYLFSVHTVNCWYSDILHQWFNVSIHESWLTIIQVIYQYDSSSPGNQIFSTNFEI